VQEGQAGQILAPLARVARSTFANVVRTGRVRLEANAKFTLVVLTWRRLWVHHGHQGFTFAELARKFRRTLARVIVDAVDAGSTILAHMVLAVINVLRAIGPTEPWHALTGIVREMVNTLGSILTRIEIQAAEFNLSFAVFPCVAGRTGAAV
jgi:hypothetical protein